MTNAPSLRPGDRVPDFALPALDGKLRKFNWSFTGEPVVLLVVEDLGSVDRDQLTNLLAACKAASARFVALCCNKVAAAGPVWTRLGMNEEAALLLCDGDRNFAPALLSQGGMALGQIAVLRSRVIVFDPNQRVAAVFDARPLPAAAEAIGALADGVRSNGGAGTVLSSAMAPVLVLPRVFEPDFCEQLMRLWAKGDHRDSGVSSRYGNVDVAKFKRTEDYTILEPMMQKAISDRLAWRIGPELIKVFGFDREFSFDAHIVLSYSAEGRHFFGAHRDNGAPTTADRAFAVSLNLNDDYEGGELIFPEYAAVKVRPPAGAAAVFSCSILHEALPVTSGRRYVLTTFFRQKRQKPAANPS